LVQGWTCCIYWRALQ